MMLGGGWLQRRHHCGLRVVILTLTIVLQSRFASAEDIQPYAQKCVIYPVDFDKPAPWYEARSYSDTAISFNLLFDSVNATLHIKADEETSLNPCEVRISKDTHLVDGTCLSDDDIKMIPLRIHDEDEWSTLIIRRRGPLLVLYDSSGNTKVLQQNPSSTSRVEIYVSSEGPVNMAYDCNRGCKTFETGVIHSNEALHLSAQLLTNETNKGNITVMYGIGESLWEEKKLLQFSFNEHPVPEDDQGWKDFVIEPVFGATTTGESYMLTVNGSLVGDPLYIGSVPTLDMYLKFENTVHIQWSVNCPHANARPTMTSTTYVPKRQITTQAEETSPDDGQTDTDQTLYDDLLTTNSDWDNEIMNSDPSPEATAELNHETTVADEEATSEDLPSEEAPSEEAPYEETPSEEIPSDDPPSEEPYSETLPEETPEYETYPEPTADDSTVYIPPSEQTQQTSPMEVTEEETTVEVEKVMIEAPAAPKREAQPTPKEELWTLPSSSTADRLPKSSWMICLILIGYILVC
ncbi:unnamed protein product [Meganyctiphanes norvegica]|uniref:Uncharacterized protein n=1 Tax=Meganyctiphanes norvegica TaxID=48144 RepID=A0AAV2Q083_MEGNR